MTKKILLIATVQSHICQFHKPLVEVLKKHGYEVHVAARNNLAEKNGLKLDFVDQIYDLPFARSPKSTDNITAYKQLKKVLDENDYEVIHCNTPMGGIVTRLAARKARKSGARVFYTAHGFHFYNGAPKKNWLVFYPIEKFFSRLTDTLITITHEDYALASKKFHCRVEHIHGVGVDDQRYYPVSEEEQKKLREELGFTEDQRILLCIGELLPNKNQSMAIRMMKEVIEAVPNTVLLIAGNGPERERLEKEIEECGYGDHIRMLGYCTCLEKYQRITDVLVACSRREGLPLNLVEAMLNRNPVVASVNRGHRELVKDGETGYLVPVDDDHQMAEHVIRLLTDDRLAAEIGQKAYDYAKSYTFTNVKKELEQIYFG